MSPTDAVVGYDVPVVKLVIVGAAGDPTVNDDVVVTVPEGAVTDTGPVVAPVGTVTVMEVDVTTDGVALAPLNETDVFETVPNAVPVIVTVLPIAP